MNLNSYKLTRQFDSSNPRKQMLREKTLQTNMLYEFAVDREDNCLINNREFVKSPRIWDRKIKTNYFQTITMETIERDDYFYSGDLLAFDNSFWICTSSFVFHKLYCKGNYIKCNYLLKWQDKNGKIIEKYCLVQSAAQYNSGETGNNTIILGSDQLMIVLPKDQDTLILDTPVSFFIDWNIKNPTAYKITRNDTVPYSDWKYGCISLIVTQRATKQEDNIELGICDYFSPTTPPDPDPPDETANLFANISGNTNLKVGFPRSYLVNFTDKDGAVVGDVDFEWNVESEFADKVSQASSGNTIKLQIDDDTQIGESFFLSIWVEGKRVGEIEITIVEGF